MSVATTASSEILPINVTVIPADPQSDQDDDNWIQDNPVVVTVMIISALIAIAIVVCRCWRHRRKGSSTASETRSISTIDISALGAPKNTSVGAINSGAYANSFIIVEGDPGTGDAKISEIKLDHISKDSVRRQSEKTKPKQMLAVPPLFTVSQPRRSSSAHINHQSHRSAEQRRRKTAADMEQMFTATEGPRIIDADEDASQQSHPTYLMTMPVVLRKVTQGPNHAVYVRENVE